MQLANLAWNTSALNSLSTIMSNIAKDLRMESMSDDEQTNGNNTPQDISIINSNDCGVNKIEIRKEKIMTREQQEHTFIRGLRQKKSLSNPHSSLRRVKPPLVVKKLYKQRARVTSMVPQDQKPQCKFNQNSNIIEEMDDERIIEDVDITYVKCYEGNTPLKVYKTIECERNSRSPQKATDDDKNKQADTIKVVQLKTDNEKCFHNLKRSNLNNNESQEKVFSIECGEQRPSRVPYKESAFEVDQPTVDLSKTKEDKDLLDFTRHSKDLYALKRNNNSDEDEDNIETDDDDTNGRSGNNKIIHIVLNSKNLQDYRSAQDSNVENRLESTKSSINFELKPEGNNSLQNESRSCNDEEATVAKLLESDKNLYNCQEENNLDPSSCEFNSLCRSNQISYPEGHTTNVSDNKTCTNFDYTVHKSATTPINDQKQFSYFDMSKNVVTDNASRVTDPTKNEIEKDHPGNETNYVDRDCSNKLTNEQKLLDVKASSEDWPHNNFCYSDRCENAKKDKKESTQSQMQHYALNQSDEAKGCVPVSQDENSLMKDMRYKSILVTECDSYNIQQQQEQNASNQKPLLSFENVHSMDRNENNRAQYLLRSEHPLSSVSYEHQTQHDFSGREAQHQIEKRHQEEPRQLQPHQEHQDMQPYSQEQLFYLHQQQQQQQQLHLHLHQQDLRGHSSHDLHHLGFHNQQSNLGQELLTEQEQHLQKQTEHVHLMSFMHHSAETNRVDQQEQQQQVNLQGLYHHQPQQQQQQQQQQHQQQHHQHIQLQQHLQQSSSNMEQQHHHQTQQLPNKHPTASSKRNTLSTIDDLIIDEFREDPNATYKLGLSPSNVKHENQDDGYETSAGDVLTPNSHSSSTHSTTPQHQIQHPIMLMSLAKGEEQQQQLLKTTQQHHQHNTLCTPLNSGEMHQSPHNGTTNERDSTERGGPYNFIEDNLSTTVNLGMMVPPRDSHCDMPPDFIAAIAAEKNGSIFPVQHPHEERPKHMHGLSTAVHIVSQHACSQIVPTKDIDFAVVDVNGKGKETQNFSSEDVSVAKPPQKRRGRKKKILAAEGQIGDRLPNIFVNDTNISGGNTSSGTELLKSKERKKHDRFNGMLEEEVIKRTIPDHLCDNLDIVIVGINPGLFAAYKGHHYAGPGNHFWKCLYLSGLTQEQMTADEDYKLMKFGIGFTNMVQRATKGSADLTRKEIKDGCRILLEKLQRFRPKIAVFNGKLIFEVFSGKKDFNFGRQPECVEGTDTYIWVMPSSSARCAQLPRAADKVPFYGALKKFRDYLNGLILHIDESECIFTEQRIREVCEKQNTKNLSISSGSQQPGGMMYINTEVDSQNTQKFGTEQESLIYRGGNNIRSEDTGTSTNINNTILSQQRNGGVNNFMLPSLHGPQVEKKKRGRPKKNKLQEIIDPATGNKIQIQGNPTQSSINNYNILNLSVIMGGEETPKKKRGRPKKLKLSPEMMGGQSDTVAQSQPPHKLNVLSIHALTSTDYNSASQQEHHHQQDQQTQQQDNLYCAPPPSLLYKNNSRDHSPVVTCPYPQQMQLQQQRQSGKPQRSSVEGVVSSSDILPSPSASMVHSQHQTLQGDCNNYYSAKLISETTADRNIVRALDSDLGSDDGRRRDAARITERPHLRESSPLTSPNMSSVNFNSSTDPQVVINKSENFQQWLPPQQQHHQQSSQQQQQQIKQSHLQQEEQQHHMVQFGQSQQPFHHQDHHQMPYQPLPFQHSQHATPIHHEWQSQTRYDDDSRSSYLIASPHNHSGQQKTILPQQEQQQEPQQHHQEPNLSSDVTSKSLSGLESLVDQIPNISESEATVLTSAVAAAAVESRLQNLQTQGNVQGHHMCGENGQPEHFSRTSNVSIMDSCDSIPGVSSSSSGSKDSGSNTPHTVSSIFGSSSPSSYSIHPLNSTTSAASSPVLMSPHTMQQINSNSTGITNDMLPISITRNTSNTPDNSNCGTDSVKPSHNTPCTPTPPPTQALININSNSNSIYTSSSSQISRIPNSNFSVSNLAASSSNSSSAINNLNYGTPPNTAASSTYHPHLYIDPHAAAAVAHMPQLPVNSMYSPLHHPHPHHPAALNHHHHHTHHHPAYGHSPANDYGSSYNSSAAVAAVAGQTLHMPSPNYPYAYGAPSSQSNYAATIHHPHVAHHTHVAHHATAMASSVFERLKPSDIGGYSGF